MLRLSTMMLTWALLVVAAGAQAADKLTIGFVERAGYSYLDNGTAKGFLVDIATKDLTKAGIDYEFKALPQNRLTETIKAGAEQVCALGLFKNPEREAFANFTAPIYQNQPMGVVVRKDDARFAQYKALKDVFATGALTFGATQGFSYGPVVDGMIDQAAARKERASVPPSQYVALLSRQRIDFMLADPEELDALTKEAGVDAGSVTLLHFPDIPEGNKRYLMCSKAVPAATIEAINKAIGG